MIYLGMAIAVPLIAAAVVRQTTGGGRLRFAATAFLTLTALSAVGLVLSYDCFNADCGGRDDVSGYGAWIGMAGLLVCGVAAVARTVHQRRKGPA